ncbi:MAG: GntR family transcriptional regulator [Hyphomicrobiales bacterium]
MPAPDQRPVPLYEHVKRQLAEAILIGKWPPGEVLPNEVALASRFGVAVGTVRRALAEMTAEGMLARRRKTGTVVTGRSPQHNLRNFFQYFRLHGVDGTLLRSSPRVLSLTRGPATAGEAATFGIAAGAELIRLHRLRRVGGVPVMHERLVLAAERLPGFPHLAAAVPDLLYLHLLDRYGIRLSAVRESVTAEVATTEDRGLLRLSSPAAVLVIDEIAYDQAGSAMILGQHRSTSSGYCYINEIS